MTRADWLAGGGAVLILAAAGYARVEASAKRRTIAMLERQVSEQQHRIALVQDHDELENLQDAYGYYLDKALWDQVADLFAEDGTLEIGMRGVYVGKPHIRKALELFGPAGLREGHVANHIQLQPVIDVAPDGRTARVRARAMIQNGVYGGKGVWGDGIYENQFVKEQGVWKFKTVRFYTVFGSDYDKGWANAAIGAPLPSAEIPPDRRATDTYRNYPDRFIPPFHYANPVTGRR